MIGERLAADFHCKAPTTSQLENCPQLAGVMPCKALFKLKEINPMFQASHTSTKMVGTSLSEDKATKNMNDRRKASSGLSLQGSDYISTRKLSIVGRSYAVQSPIVPSIALSATTSLDQPHEDPPFTQGMQKVLFPVKLKRSFLDFRHLTFFFSKHHECIGDLA